MYKEPGKCDQFSREEVINRCQLDMTQMIEFSSKGFKATIIAMFHEVNALKINGKLLIPSRETETINNNQMGMTELKTRISIIKKTHGMIKKAKWS